MPKKRPSKKQSARQQPYNNNSKQRKKNKKPPTRRKQNERTISKSSKSKPTTLQDENGRDVWIAAANVADIRRAQRTKKGNIFKKNRTYLHTVSAAQQRQECYDRAAAAWQDLEQSLLPKYGGRSWQVIVRLTDPLSSTSKKKKKNKPVSPYFVFGKKGLLELAAWPHMLLRIPDPPRFPGFDIKVKPEKEPEPEKTKRKPKQEEQEEEESEESEQEEDVSVEESQEGEEESGEDAGGEEVDNNENNDDEADDEEQEQEEPSDNGDEEQVDEESESEEEDEESESEEEESETESEDEAEEDLDPEVEDLQERSVTPLSTLAWEIRSQVPVPNVTIKWISPLLESFTSRAQAWDRAVQLARNEVFLDKTLLGVDTATGKQVAFKPPPQQPSNKKKSASTSSGSSVISKRLALKAGKLRFERDGLWVVGQEEDWQQERWNEHMDAIDGDETNATAKSANASADASSSSTGVTKQRKLTPLAFYLQCNRKAHQAKRQQEQQYSSAFTLRQAESELRTMWKESLTEEDRQEWARRTSTAVAATGASEPSVTSAGAKLASSVQDRSAVVSPSNHGDHDDEGDGDRKMPAIAQTSTVPATATATATTSASTSDAVCVTPPSETMDEGVDGLESNASGTSRRRLDMEATEGPAVAAAAATTASLSVATMPPSKAIGQSSPCSSDNQNLFVPSTYWRLTKEQIRLCYNAGIEHYENIMATVNARDLSRELQDGFDLLRERGRGRFDMELPVFDTPTFRFLTDLKKAPWMPVVRQILGKDVALIHKGMFLSLPGAETQEYHQDGVHLNKQYQKPCHAINVFIPLIDLTLKSGPTEFCLGSHFLGQEEYNRKFLETPLVKAGTPVIFDYRLGHKGLCNQGTECRPIVYCTYTPAAAGSEFRDSVNFSRKRYHRIGDLVQQGPTREERARKRKLFVEEQAEQEQIQQARVKSTRVTSRSVAARNDSSGNSSTRSNDRTQAEPQLNPGDSTEETRTVDYV